MSKNKRKSTELDHNIGFGPFDYQRSSDGCDDTFDIYRTTDGTVVASIPFWDCDSERIARSESTARLFAGSRILLDALKGVVAAEAKADPRYRKTAIKRAQAVIANVTGAK